MGKGVRLGDGMLAQQGALRGWLRCAAGGLAAACLVGLAACGGAAEQTGATDLLGAYEVIDQGMSEAQLKAVVGVPAQRRQPDGAQTEILTWETDANTYRHVTLLVTVHAQDGVTRKVLLGYRGNFSQAY